MTFLLDTNLVSEDVAEGGNPGVKAWLQALNPADGYLSVITLLEIRYGASIVDEGRKRATLEHWLDEVLPAEFGENILPINTQIANMAGLLIARAQKAGRPAEVNDALIAATAAVHGLTVVTRNVSDFEVWGGPILNPWT